jgi:hypothetical protein
LADAAAEAELVAAIVPLREGAHFMRQRRAIRDALAEDGIAATIDALVARLLDPLSAEIFGRDEPFTLTPVRHAFWRTPDLAMVRFGGQLPNRPAIGSKNERRTVVTPIEN